MDDGDDDGGSFGSWNGGGGCLYTGCPPTIIPVYDLGGSDTDDDTDEVLVLFGNRDAAAATIANAAACASGDERRAFVMFTVSSILLLLSMFVVDDDGCVVGSTSLPPGIFLSDDIVELNLLAVYQRAILFLVIMEDNLHRDTITNQG